ncbi:hypothetical protein ILYODFUR_028088 [Ilyodon furcidens]|uniref:Uncharacterized protein n=1 Tax=Ilyodon furcidens TaxID=33524 RepID=A0ABV0UD16_9TELE
MAKSHRSIQKFNKSIFLRHIAATPSMFIVKNGIHRTKKLTMMLVTNRVVCGWLKKAARFTFLYKRIYAKTMREKETHKNRFSISNKTTHCVSEVNSGLQCVDC